MGVDVHCPVEEVCPVHYTLVFTVDSSLAQPQSSYDEFQTRFGGHLP